MEKHFEQVASHFSTFDTYDNEAENSFFDEPDNFSILGGIFNPAYLANQVLSKKEQRKRKLKRSRATQQYNRDQALVSLDERATQKMLQPETVALENVEANRPLIASYVANAGQVPQRNPAALALQATEVFQNNVQQRQQSGVPDYEAASNAEMESTADEWHENNADEFFGAIAVSVFKAGSALVKKINQGREANGKKPLFAGKNWQRLAEKYNANSGVVDEALTANERAFLSLTAKENQKVTAVGSATDAVIDYQTKEAFKKYLPLIIIILVAVFFIGKKS